MTLETQNLTLNDDRVICAPAGLKLMTNYVLSEQGEWFEDEIEFVRSFVKPGMNALDIGANYGLYSSVIARSLSGEGSLRCFEPTPDTAAALRETCKLNSLEPVMSILEFGLSSKPGEATFFMSDNAELNSLHETSVASKKITIQLDTLDRCMEDQDWPAIDFIKLDAEGEEISILEGGARFFEKNDPLVMFELKHGDQINHGLIGAFKSLGLEPYCLIKSLNALVPFDESKPADGFLLNLFAASPVCAAKLEKEGVLLTQKTVSGTKTSEQRDPSSLLSGAELSLNDGDYYAPMLKVYAASRDETLPLNIRYASLLNAQTLLSDAISKSEEKRPECVMSIARICFDVGQRSFGNRALDLIIQNFAIKGVPFEVQQPFLSFDELDLPDSKGALKLELIAASTEKWIRSHAYSSYFGNAPMIVNYIQFLERIGMASSYVERIKGLLQERAS
jgi:FkbM family methyltransferase